MPSTRSPRLAPYLVLGALVPACVAPAPPGGPGGGGPAGKGDSSDLATFLRFEFDGELVTSSDARAEAKIEEQLLYTVGQLNAENSVGRLDNVVLTDVRSDTLPSGDARVVYHARMTVAWGDRANVPSDYTLLLPRTITGEALSAFTERYKDACAGYAPHGVDVDSMWYYYRPRASGCVFADEDVVRLPATVVPSGTETQGRYPEYHKIWEDGLLRFVGVFAKDEAGKRTVGEDVGIRTYADFVDRAVAYAQEHGDAVAIAPEGFVRQPDAETPEVRISAELPGGRRLEVIAFLVDGVQIASQTFYEHYGDVSERADFITYEGHSGLGANIRAIARHGRWVPGQYVIFMENGCDSYAYVDDALGEAHRAINPDDLTGSKYVDMVMNAMPAPFAPETPYHFLDGLMNEQSYQAIFRRVPASQVVLVSGEEDNVYYPGYAPGQPSDGDPVPAWTGHRESGVVALGEERRTETTELPPGTYLFALTGDGDADLYVRVGAPPTDELYDCRPYDPTSQELCELTLGGPAVVHLLVRGYAERSAYELVGQSR